MNHNESTGENKAHDHCCSIWIPLWGLQESGTCFYSCPMTYAMVTAIIRHLKPKTMGINNYILNFNSEQKLSNSSILNKETFHSLHFLSLREKLTMCQGPMRQYYEQLGKMWRKWYQEKVIQETTLNTKDLGFNRSTLNGPWQDQSTFNTLHFQVRVSSGRKTTTSLKAQERAKSYSSFQDSELGLRHYFMSSGNQMLILYFPQS